MQSRNQFITEKRNQSSSKALTEQDKMRFSIPIYEQDLSSQEIRNCKKQKQNIH